ncbi:MAG TPA: hypothetical protein VE783_10660 [Candidatus Limnocylindrales bacterium]|jgi:tetratricopeptide (TPR) repeat protein|nr:hypothetical protein [Candidatus Limnocylindrales bacterium]
MRKLFLGFLLIAFTLPAVCQQDTSTSFSATYAGQMEITTRSPEARTYFERGLARMQVLHWEEAMREWRDAVAADPQFALGHALLAMLSRDPVEQVAERDKAAATRAYAGPEEKLIVDWVVNTNQSRWVPAIQAMNEALADYPQDKYLAWLAGLWLTNQRQSERAIAQFERANQIDPKFADPLNQAAYCYARLGDFDRAFNDLQRYASMMPNEANPQDSLGEISRMAGRFDDSLAHYHESLKIDPGFVESRAGIGDTFAVMGEQAKARSAYADAISHAQTRVQSVSFALQSAATFTRDQEFGKADASFEEVARQAHDQELGILEAEAWRIMSVYQKDNGKAIKLLSRAEAVLGEKHKMSAAAREQELALILRTRVGRSVHDGSMHDALASLKRMQQLVATNNDGRVRSAFSGAQGAVLMAQGKFEEAIAQLEEDDKNAFSMQRLIVAYDKTGQKDKAARMKQRLAKYYEPSIEQAVVVPLFNKTTLAMKDKN